MSTFLFDSIIVGPLRSRRLGLSLGINLLTPEAKLCNFNCIYCECGWNGEHGRGAFNPTDRVISSLEVKLQEMQQAGELPDVITFAGNGEPTMHPDFEHIIDSTIALRDRYALSTKIAVLSNATMIDRESVRAALLKVDRNILKFDSALPATVEMIDQPQRHRTVERTIALMQLFEGRLVVQTMLLRGNYNGARVDNTTDEEVAAWLDAMRRIAPSEIMLYTIDRDTPASGLEKVSVEDMSAIARRAEELDLGIKVSVAQ